MTTPPCDFWFTSAVFLYVVLYTDLNFLGHKTEANLISLEITKLLSHLALPNNTQFFSFLYTMIQTIIQISK